MRLEDDGPVTEVVSGRFTFEKSAAAPLLAADARDEKARSPELRRLLGEIIAAQHEALRELAAAREIDPALADRLQHEVDLEASRFEST